MNTNLVEGDTGADLEIEDLSVSGGLENAIEYNRIVKSMNGFVSDSKGKDMGGNRLVAHCNISINGMNILAQVDAGANVTCITKGMCNDMHAIMRKVEGRLEDYMGRSEERLGVVSLLVTKKGCAPIRWTCEVVDRL